MLYDSDVVWLDLARAGRCRLGDYWTDEIAQLRRMLHKEAAEEGVQLRINADRVDHVSNDLRCVYVYLRKLS